MNRSVTDPSLARLLWGLRLVEDSCVATDSDAAPVLGLMRGVIAELGVIGRWSMARFWRRPQGAAAQAAGQESCEWAREDLGGEEVAALGALLMELEPEREAAWSALEARLEQRGAQSVWLQPLRAGGRTIGLMAFVDASANRQAEDTTPAEVLSELDSAIACLEVLGALVAERDRVARSLVFLDSAAWTWDLESGEVSWTADSARLFGDDQPENAEPERLLWHAQVHEDDAHRLGELVEQARAEQGTFEATYRIRRPDGEVRWLEARGVFAGHTMHGIATDVTARRLEREWATDALQWFHRLADALPDVVFVYDLEADRFEYLNKAGEELGPGTGKLTEMGDRALPLVVAPDELEGVREFFGQVVRHGEGQPLEREHRFRFREGQSRWLSIRATPFGSREGTRLLGVARDVSGLRRMQDEQARADRRKDEFLAILGHELRNPLSAVRTGLELLSAGVDEATSERVRAAMTRQVEQVVSILDDLLDISRATQGKIHLRRGNVSLVRVVTRSVDATKGQMEKRGQTLEVSCPESLSAFIDEARLTQVVTNLLSNASKYSFENSVIRLECSEQAGQIEIAVSDPGIGVENDDHERIFEPFAQHSGQDYRHEGLGIGLALVRRIVELHGGKVWVESSGVAGEGATFRVRIPRRAQSESEVAEQGAPAVLPVRRQRVLLVEDQPDVATNLAMVLEHAGLQVSVASTGHEAVKRAADERPEAIIIDIGLPDMTGLEVARLVRGFGLKDCLLVALSGYGHERARRDSEQAGCDYHLAKPAKPDELLALLGVPPTTPG